MMMATVECYERGKKREGGWEVRRDGREEATGEGKGTVLVLVKEDEGGVRRR